MKLLPTSINYSKLVERYKDWEWVLITYKPRVDKTVVYLCKDEKTLLSSLQSIAHKIVMKNQSLYIDYMLHKGKSIDYRKYINIDISLSWSKDILACEKKC